ncbi:probable nucleoredoxin 1-2 isoform X2 [Zingiber officinale]|nr:probable nucleoredoxin 1-2 isoform X2 [Zingiber officinale]
MPWLAIPFSDTTVKKKLKEIFQERRRPALVIIDANGKVLNTEGVQAVRGYGAESYPFTVEKISELREEAENAKKDQTLRSLLVSSSRDYLIANDRSKVSVSNLEGKTVALYFPCNTNYYCAAHAKFDQVLAEIYRKLKEIGESFEVVLVSLKDEECSYNSVIEKMPWLAFPFNDKSCDKLFCYFGLWGQKYKCSTVILIGSDGKTMDVDLIELTKKYGFEAWEAFPFSQEKLLELSEKAKIESESQTLESLLVSGDLDYVINGKKGLKVLVKELVGKTILLQFGYIWNDAHVIYQGYCWGEDQVDYLHKLIEEYYKIKNVDTNFEVIFVPEEYDKDDKYDNGVDSFDEILSRIPWLTLPFDDERSGFLNRRFKIRGEPSQLIVIGPTGRTITNDAMKLLMIHGADAYPFTEEKLKELEHRNKEMPERWPKKIRHDHLHKGGKHALLLIRCYSTYRCDGCQEIGHNWSYCCITCDFDLHPKCALWWW